MAEPFVFHFRRADDGAPHQMYMADVRAACTVCGHPQMQRFYHATDLHLVTEARLEELARAVPKKTAYDCPNCGSPVGPDGCVDAALTWAFPDDAGVLRAFVAGDSISWQIAPRRRLDPQELPGWGPDDRADWPVAPTLEAEWVEGHVGRPVNPKALLRDELQGWVDDPEGGAIIPVNSHFVVVAAGPDASLDALCEEARSEMEGEVVTIPFADASPTDLCTYREASNIPCGLGSWLPRDVVSRLDELAALIATDHVVDVVRRAFDVANLDYVVEAGVIRDITTPRELAYPRHCSVWGITQRAVYTGLTPGDAARLTAEEIVGTLLRVW